MPTNKPQCACMRACAHRCRCGSFCAIRCRKILKNVHAGACVNHYSRCRRARICPHIHFSFFKEFSVEIDTTKKITTRTPLLQIFSPSYNPAIYVSQPTRYVVHCIICTIYIIKDTVAWSQIISAVPEQQHGIILLHFLVHNCT